MSAVSFSTNAINLILPMPQSDLIPNAECAVIGNPIEHSLSPQIHHSFAEQTNINLNYRKVLLTSEQLNDFIINFYQQGGVGINVTAPFKTQVMECLDELSEAAQTCNSVNTIYKNHLGKLVGDSTDGAGFLLDLKRLGFIDHAKKVAIVGAGGAAWPVALELLKAGVELYILNRTEQKVADMIQRLSRFGTVRSLAAADSDNLLGELELDGIVSATSVFNPALFDQASQFLKPQGFVYDLNYAERANSLLSYCRKLNIQLMADGYGMLLGQAAKSFEIWHGKLPKIEASMS